MYALPANILQPAVLGWIVSWATLLLMLRVLHLHFLHWPSLVTMFPKKDSTKATKLFNFTPYQLNDQSCLLAWLNINRFSNVPAPDGTYK